MTMDDRLRENASMTILQRTGIEDTRIGQHIHLMIRTRGTVSFFPSDGNFRRGIRVRWKKHRAGISVSRDAGLDTSGVF